MTIELLKKLIEAQQGKHADFIRKAKEAERYYETNNDILLTEKKKDSEGNPLRNADNRIPRNFHGFLVDQKAAYGLLTPPVFDTGKQSVNEMISTDLGDDYVKNITALCVDAANCSVGWLHYWVTENNVFEYAVVDPKTIVAIHNTNLKKQLIGVLRIYSYVDDDGAAWHVYEYWDDTFCQTYRKSCNTGNYFEKLENLEEYFSFRDADTGEELSFKKHSYGEVPFIEFRNNNKGQSDLVEIKRFIDVYDKVYSGFINDLDDIQELIFVLSNYGGQSLQEFLEELKKYKVINVDEDGDVKTLNIEIPVEARKEALEITREAIYEQGKGFDPRPKEFGNQSGVALQFTYALLEQKVALMEIEFRSGFNKLVRAICRHHGQEVGRIVQTWTRTRIRNAQEQAQVCSQSVGIVSKRTVLANHPFVQDVESELKLIAQEEADDIKKADDYAGSFGKPKKDDDTDDIESDA